MTIKAVNTFKGGVIRKCMNAIKKMKQGMNSKTSFLWACTSSKADFWIGKGTKETAPQVGRNISAMMVKAYVVLMKKVSQFLLGSQFEDNTIVTCVGKKRTLTNAQLNSITVQCHMYVRNESGKRYH